MPTSFFRSLRLIRRCLSEIRKIDQELPASLAAVRSILTVLLRTLWLSARLTKVRVRQGVRWYARFLVRTSKTTSDLLGHSLVIAGVLWIYWLAFLVVGAELARRFAFTSVSASEAITGVCAWAALMLVFFNVQVVQRRLLSQLKQLSWWRRPLNYLLLCPK